ncbi:MAG: hypothetical protein JO366_09560 [Methylobacteriaceae bacterium]|nr:hypothetical protein [Methylobacteriaceae bacterium]
MFRKSLLGIAAAVLLAQPAMAAEVTSDGANALLDTFQRYVGKPAAGETGTVAVKVDGETYLVSFDLQKAAKPLETLGVKVDPAVISFHLTPQDDGTWRVGDATFPEQLQYELPGQKTTYSAGGFKFEGIYDPKIATFTEATVKLARYATQSVMANGSVSAEMADISNDNKATTVADGVATFHVKEMFGAFSEAFNLSAPPSASGASPITKQLSFTLKGRSGTGDIGLDAMHGQALLDLWAFLVAHPSQQQIVDATSELKGLLSAAIPVFDKAKVDATLEDVSIDTAVGSFALKGLGFSFSGTGVTPQAHFGMNWQANGLVIPEQLVRPWQKPFVPTEFVLGASVTGFDVAAGVREAIADFDPAKTPPISPEADAKIGAAFKQGGPIKVTVEPGRLVSELVEIDWSGDVTVTEPKPTVKLTVTAKGLDRALDALQAAAATDQFAAQAIVGLANAKRMGKAGADGATSWLIEVDPDGKTTINGTPVGAR